jgi:hypothetical protein
MACAKAIHRISTDVTEKANFEPLKQQTKNKQQ